MRVMLVALPLLVAVLVGCNASGSDGPLRNPAAGERTPASATAPPTATAPLTATVRPSEPGSGDGAGTPGDAPPSSEALEIAVGTAIELLAEWLAVPATDLTVAEAEAIVWTDGCIGIARPGAACDDALTPGFRFVLRDGSGSAHTVHSDTRGLFLWAGEQLLRGTLGAVDRRAGLLEVEVEGDAVILRLVPGSSIVDLAAAEVGDAIIVAVDAAPDDAGVRVVVWAGPAGTP